MEPEPAALDAASKGIRDLIVSACRVLDAHDQGDMVWGHVSVRDPTGRGIWFKGGYFGFDEVGPDDIILLDFDGRILQGGAGLYHEYPIHTEIMRARPDVHGVVHTHPLHSIAFAATRRPLLPLSHHGAHFVPPDVARFTETGDLVDTPELGRALAATLGSRNVAFMPSHGIVTAAQDLGRATALAVVLERACQIALLAGPDAVGSDDEEALHKRTRSTRNIGQAWEYFARHVSG